MTVHRGIFPIAPTPFTPEGDLDLGSQRRALDYLIDARVDGICILANYSEQFALTDAEREQLTGLVLDHVAGRVPVIVTTSHFASRVAAARSRAAQAAGAAMVMVMPPYHGATLRVAEAGIREHIAAIADAIDIPVMIQDAPMAGTPLTAPFLAGLAREIPGVRYFKLENGVAADKLRELIRLGGDAIEGPFDGEESITLIPDLEAGATGTMPGCTTVDVLRRTWDLWHAGQRDEAVAVYERAQPLITYENRLCGLMASKALMAEGGIIACELPRHPTRPLSAPVRATLVAMARRLDLLVLRWAR
jgi:4-hydroxy-tetrahydrodipicolinate synthase/2-keto-3-deoxy-L-arabinonate dehydratase